MKGGPDGARRAGSAAGPKEPSLPNTRRPPAQQPPAADFRGIEIAAPGSAPGDGPVVVSGTFVIPEQEALRIDERLHRALVLVKVSMTLYHVTNPFRDVILFEDDEERVAGTRRGFFSFNAFDGFARAPGGDYYITVSLGDRLSNTVRVFVT
jgi:hypothetical protein